MYFDTALDLIRKHEGLSLTVYECPAGYLTIGYGRNLETKGITRAEAETLLIHDIDESIEDLRGFHFWEFLDDAQRAAVIDMRFNLGPSGFRKFKRFIAALESRDYAKAGREMADSLWWNQVGDRAKTLRKMIEQK